MPSQRYLFIQRSTPSAGPRTPPTPEQMSGMYAAFNAWKEKFADNILDLGGKLEAGGKVLTSAGVTDGPFAETKELIGGYMLVRADSYEQALEVARESPGATMPGSSIEIRAITSAG